MRAARPHWIVPAVTAAALVVCGLGWYARPLDFYRGYLPVFLFWLGVPLGAMAFLLIHQLTGGDWGAAIQRPARACVLTLPLMAVLFVPVIAGLGRLYPWAGTEILRQSLHLGNKASYLNASFFIARAVIYFVIWIGTGFLLLSLLARQDQAPNPERAGRLGAIGAVGLILYVLTMTLAAVDWMMSLDPAWYSTIFGFYVIAGQGLSGMAMMIVVVVTRESCQKQAGLTPSPLGERAGVRGERSSLETPAVSRAFPGLENSPAPVSPRRATLSQEGEGMGLTPPVLHDLGNLLFMTVFFYAYIAFSQFLIIWSGNIREEVSWYVARKTGAWGYVPYILVVTHFALPFALLLSRTIKRRAGAMLAIALLLLAARALDVAWMVLPSFTGLTGWTWLLAAASFVGVGCLWWMTFSFMGGTSVPRAAAEMSGPTHHSETA